MTSLDAAPDNRNRLSRRMHRVRLAVRWSLLGLAGCLLLWLGMGQLSRERRYNPGEEIEGITREMERPAGLPGGGLRFIDITREAGLSSFLTFAGQRTSQLPEDMGGGVAWGDYDNDGDDDLFVVSAGGPLHAPEAELAPSILYENIGGGRFLPHAGFPDLQIRGMGAAWADVDNDGWLDLAVTGYDTILMFLNRQGQFAPSGTIRPRPGFWTGASWGDFNRDGWPDLYVCGYVKYRYDLSQRTVRTQQFGQAVPHTLNPSSYAPERNLLFRNDGKGGFQEVAAQLGVDNPSGRSLSALWHDFDNNGWPDLYVANDISESKLYLNREGRFEDAGSSAWVAEYRGSMGLAAGDFDRDGDDDLFISHWVAQQFALYESLLAQQSLLKTGGGKSEGAILHFTDVAEMRGIGQPTLRSIGWGAEFADFDSDGWLDLAVAAGSTFESDGEPKRLLGLPSFLFRNIRGENFAAVADEGFPLRAARVSRGLAVSDFDGDGDVDLAIVDLDGGVRLIRNDSRQGHNLRLSLRGRPDRPWSGGDGAQVTAWLGGTRLRRTVSSASYLSQSSRSVHIGLGEASMADRVAVRWPDGQVEDVGPLKAGVTWRLTPGQPPLALRAGMSERERQIAFWDRQRAAMDRLKRDRDPRSAALLFRDALALDPRHEDARYYLASCLASLGDARGAMREIEALLAVNPSSHRALQRLAYLRAAKARGESDLRQAAKEARRAHALNPEETGALLLLAEIELLRGRPEESKAQLIKVVRSNHRSALAHFLLAYLEMRAGKGAASRAQLEATVRARGKEWKPRGSVQEGDVEQRMHEDTSLLAPLAETWDGKQDPRTAFAALDRRLSRGQQGRSGASR